MLSIVGKNSNFEKAGTWWASVPSEKRPPESNKEFYSWLLKIWDETYGDRRTELVFIGQKFDPTKLKAALQSALLNQSEIDTPSKWEKITDPFPPWSKIQEVTDQFEFSVKQASQDARSS